LLRLRDHWHAMAPSIGTRLRDVSGNRDFDLNLDGMAHYGLLPDFLQDMRNVGVTHNEMRALESSAEDYIQTWERAEQHRLPRFATVGRQLVENS
jgi:hypothetical protein